MSCFTYLAWVDTSVPQDHMTAVQDAKLPIASIVQEILQCGESFDKSSNSIGYKKLRIYIRQGLPAVVRPNAWKTLTVCSKVVETTPTLFQDLQDDLEYALFSRPDHFFSASFVQKHYLTDEGWKKCQEVLAALSQLHCDVTFCPILQQFVCIFMHFMDKEDCFACIDSMFSSRKYSLDKSTTDYCIRAATFQEALEKWKKPVYSWLKSSLKTNRKVTRKTIFLLDWLQWIFKYVDFWTLVHIVDNFLLDGDKVFYRVGLFIFEQMYNVHKEKVDVDNLEVLFAEVISNIAKQSLNLLNKSLRLPGISRRIISQLRQKIETLERSGMISLPYIQHETTLRALVEGSDLLSQDQVQELFSALPGRLRQLCKLTCIFSTELHGTSLTSFYQKCQDKPHTLLLVKTTCNKILGAFLSVAWNERHDHINSFFGNGETFLFHFVPEFKRYTWCALTTKNWSSPAYFMLADSQTIVVGGGNGWGLSIEEDLTHGRSERCDTFDNEPLSSSGGGEFECVRVEVWSLEEMGHLTTSSDSAET